MKRLSYMKLFCDYILIPDNFFDSILDDGLASRLFFKNKNIIVLKDINVDGKK